MQNCVQSKSSGFITRIMMAQTPEQTKQAWKKLEKIWKKRYGTMEQRAVLTVCQEPGYPQRHYWSDSSQLCFSVQ